jgi:hypothetical protein
VEAFDIAVAFGMVVGGAVLDAGQVSSLPDLPPALSAMGWQRQVCGGAAPDGQTSA